MKCVIFDCDGLMFDSERISIETWRRICKNHNILIDDEFIIGITGATADSAKTQFDRFPGIYDFIDELRSERNKQIFYEAETTGIAKKGLIELLDYLTENNYLFCVASSSKQEYVNRLLNSLPKTYPFSVIMTGDKVTHGKPDPEIFLTAAKLANVNPSDCLVLEDSRLGILAANAAGMTAGFIQDCIKKDDIIQNHMNIEFNDLSEVINYLKTKGC